MVCGQNSFFNGVASKTHQDWGPCLNQGTRFIIDMVSGSGGLGFASPTYTYFDGNGRGATAAGRAVEDPNTPFNGIVTMYTDAYYVPRLYENSKELAQIHAVNPADNAAMTTYFNSIGRLMTITKKNGSPLTGTIGAVLDDDFRSFFHISATANVAYPMVPGFAAYGVTYPWASADFDNCVVGQSKQLPQIRNTSGIRETLLDADPDFMAAVDAGTVSLKDWKLEDRPLEGQNYLASLIPTGVVNCKMIKDNGEKDAGHGLAQEVELIQKMIDAGYSNNIRYYFSLNTAKPVMGETLFTSSTGASVSLGWELNDFDLLINWVEGGTEPGDLKMLNSTVATSTLRANIKGAHQYGLQNDPADYLRKVENINDTTPPTTTVTTTTSTGSYQLGTWSNHDVAVSLVATDNLYGVRTITYSASGAQTIDSTDVTGATVNLVITAEGSTTLTFFATDKAGNAEAARSIVIQVDKTGPVIAFADNAGSYTVDQVVNITPSASDALSGVATTDCSPVVGDAYTFALGTNTLTFTATDNAGNVTTTTTSFSVTVTYDSLANLTNRFVTNHGIANSLCAKLAAAAKGSPGSLGAYKNELSAQSGKKALTESQASILSSLADALAR